MRLISFIFIPGLYFSALPAQAEDLTFTHSSGATATFYGQFDLTYQGVDDGVSSYDDFVDNDNSVTHLGLWIDVPAGENKLRFNFETALGLKSTITASQTNDDSWIDWHRTDLRHFEGVYSGNFGSVWLGQGSMASDGMDGIDNSGTSLAGHVTLTDSLTNYEFRAGRALSGINVGDTFKSFDGSRRFRFRYDTPKFSGFTFSASYGQEILAEHDDSDYYDIAARYTYDNDAFKADAGLGYAWKNAGDGDTEQLIAATSILHRPTGLNIAVGYGDGESSSGNYGYAKLGWIGDLISQGSTAVSVDYFGGNDYVVSDSDSKSWGIQTVQNFKKYNFDTYLGYREYEFDDNSEIEYHDISLLLLGGRWKF